MTLVISTKLNTEWVAGWDKTMVMVSINQPFCVGREVVFFKHPL